MYLVVNTSGIKEMARSLATLMAGTVGSQVIAFLFTPVIARLYGPDAYGAQGVFMSATVMLAAVIPLALPNAVSVADSLADARHLAALALLVSGAFSLLVLFPLLLAKEPIAAKLGLGDQSAIVLLLPAAAFGAVGTKALTEWLYRNGQYGVVARMSMTRAFATGASKAGVGLFTPTPMALILISTIGPFVGAAAYALPLLSRARKRPGAPSFAWLTRSPQLLGKYREFPFYRAPQNVLNATSQGVPVALIASLFGVTAAGQYAMTAAVLSMPVTTAGGALLAVLQRHLLDVPVDRVRKHLRASTLGLLLLAVPGVATVMLLAPQVFELVLGPKWREAGHYAQVLAPLFAMQLISRPSAAAIGRLNLQRVLLSHELISLVLRVVGLFAGYWMTNDVRVGLACFGAGGLIAYSWLIANVWWRASEGNRVG